MRVVVTGATGYIGRPVVRCLVEREFDVVALTRTLTPGTYRCLLSGREASLDEHFQDAVAVIHLAGRLVDGPGLEVEDFIRANVELTAAVMRAAARQGVELVIHASSRLVYPRTLKAPADERRDASPDSPYGLSKLWAENVVRHYSGTLGVSALSLRIGQVTGGDHSGLGVVNSFLRQARTHGRIVVQGKGVAVRDFVHVNDVVHAVSNALNYRGSWLAINIGGSRPVSVEEIARAVAHEYPGTVVVEHDHTTHEDVSFYGLDRQLAMEVLQWEPRTSLNQILAELLDR